MLLADCLPPEAREIVLCVNPNAGYRNQRATVDDLISRLKEKEFRCTVCEDIEQLSVLAADALSRHALRGVVAAGGDGTVSLLLNKTPPGTPLLILPLGTENLLSKYLELQADPAQLAKIISEGLTVYLDAGEANGQLFTLMAGCGFDADVVRRLHRNRRGRIHHLSYVRPILDSILNYSYPQLRVYYDDRDAETQLVVERSLTGRWVFVVNVPRYAGGLNLAPQAEAADGLLDISVFEEGSLWSGLWYLGGLALGQHESMSGFVRVRSARVRIEAEGNVPYQLDGDPGGELPLDVRVLPRRMRLLVSRGWHERQKVKSVEQIPRTIALEPT